MSPRTDDARAWESVARGTGRDIKKLQRQLFRIRALHAKADLPEDRYASFCVECKRPWPCDTYQLAHD